MSSTTVQSGRTGTEAAALPEQGFASRLKDGTKAVHREAERAGFISDLIRGRATRSGYALFLRNLVPIYDALERAIESMRDEPLIRPFADPGLRRLSRLTRDFETIAGEAGWSDHAVLPATEDYVRAVFASVDAEPGRLAAHAYARYLGDLSGGQILRPLLARSLALPFDALSFYDFPDVADVEQPKQAIRAALDEVDPASRSADAILEEAILAFRHNIAVSDAVAAAVAPT